MLLGIQILGILFAFFMLYLVYLHHKRKDLSSREFVLWTIAWLGFIFIIVFPEILNPFLQTLNITRIMDFVIILGFAFIIGITYKNYIGIKKNQKKLEEIVRKVAYSSKK
jgi:hypothetical protein